MELFNILAVLITLSAVFGYVNHRFIKLPTTIGLMLISLVMSLAIIILGRLGVGIEAELDFIRRIDFNKTLMVGMLSFLLFAGALHVDINELLAEKWRVGVFATLGVITSTFLIGSAMYLVLGWLHLGMPYIYCLLFGAIISPTDPIAVLGILRDAGAPEKLKINISGESLFNDGIGVVIFIILLEIATGEAEASAASIGVLFAKEAVGGFIFGLLLGWLGYWTLKSVDNYQVEVIVTLALVTGGYALALSLHTSGPIAIVVAGLLIGNHGRTFAMSAATREHLDMFWELVDEILNSVLFVLIGLELLVVSLSGGFVLAGLIAIAVALCSRFISLGVPLKAFGLGRSLPPGALKIMTWGGLRGGISVALALSLPLGEMRDLILTMTYVVVVFSILVQGLTIKYLVKQQQ